MTELNDEDIVILSIRCNHPGKPVYGAIKYPCADCGSMVWLAPSGQARLTIAKKVICAECFLKNYNDEDVEIMPIPSDIRAEIKRELGYTAIIPSQTIIDWLKKRFKED